MLRLVAAAILGLSLSVSAVPAPASVDHVAGPTRATSQGPVPMFSNGDRGVVNDTFLDTYVPLIEAATPWDGSVAGCDPGTVNPAVLERTQQTANYFRSLGGLDPVSMEVSASGDAQRAALMMVANDELSHFPPTTWRCYTAAGARAAGQANLHSGVSGPRAVAGYMLDPGDGNTEVGHRRWILNPTTTVMASGDVSGANALIVFGLDDGNPDATSPEWVPWPTAGYFPSPLEPDGRWSISSDRPETDFSDAQVTVHRGTTAVRSTEAAVVDGYGPNTLVWQMADGVADGTYTVTVSGVTREGEPVPTFSYDTTVFAPGRAIRFTSPPVVRGTARVGEVLQAIAGDTSPGGLEHSFAWFRDGRVQVGRSRSYSPVGADVGHTLEVRDTVKGDYLSPTTASATTGPVELGRAPRLLERPRLVGVAKPNRRLSLNGMRWDTPGLALSYQWMRNGVAIRGAVRPVRRLVKADARRTLSVRIRARKSGHPEVTVSSFSRVVQRK